MKWLFSPLFLFIAFTTRAQEPTDSLLGALMKAIARAPDYDSAKTGEIAHLRATLPNTNDPAALFQGYKSLYDAYSIFIYDSAYRYAEKLQAIAYHLGNPHLITESRLQLCFILLSSGLFRETRDSLEATDIHGEPDSLKALYYTLLGRYYYDLANYDYDNHSAAYDIKGNRYMYSALAFYPASSFEATYYKGLLEFKRTYIDSAAVLFRRLLAGPLTDHQLALTASTLSGIYSQKGEDPAATDLLITAAIADIRASTKETFAIFNLAAVLYKKGDVRHASPCIETAIANAEFYGARQRKVQASSILSLIEDQRISAVEAQRRLLIQYAAVVTVFVIVLVFLIITIRRQV